MAKKSKAKAKYAKTAKKKKAAKKTKSAKKTNKAKKAKKAKKTEKVLPGAPVDPCEREQQALDDADDAVQQIKDDLKNPTLSDEERRKLQQALKEAERKLRAAQVPLQKCRRLHGGHPH